MKRVSEAKLRKWNRRAEKMNRLAGLLMEEMTEILGDDTDSTDCIDNVLHSTEELVDVLARPELDQWKLPTTPTVRQGKRDR